MPTPINGEILSEIKGLAALTDEKFKNVQSNFDGIHTRLDELNHQTLKNTNFRKITMNTYKVLVGVCSACVIIAGLVISWLK